VLEMEFKLCSHMWREVGVSIYRWGFKTSCWVDFFGKDRLNRPCLTVSLSASLTSRLLRSLVKLTKNSVEPLWGVVEPL
jgi:hypothetical protein